VIKRQGTGLRETFTVRKQSFGVGVERTFPVHSPKIEQIEVAARGDVRRAKLYYLRDRVGRGARVRERRFAPGDNPNEVIVPETAAPDGEGVMPPPETDVVEQQDEAVPAAEAEDPRDEGVAEVIEADEAAAAEAEAADQPADAAPAEEADEQQEPAAEADSDDAPESEADRGA